MAGGKRVCYLFEKLNQGLPGTNSASGQNTSWTPLSPDLKASALTTGLHLVFLHLTEKCSLFFDSIGEFVNFSLLSTCTGISMWPHRFIFCSQISYSRCEWRDAERLSHSPLQYFILIIFIIVIIIIMANTNNFSDGSFIRQGWIDSPSFFSVLSTDIMLIFDGQRSGKRLDVDNIWMA